MTRKEKKNPILAITYDSRLAGVPQIIQKHYKAAEQDFKFKSTFPNKPMVAYRRQTSIGDKLVRAKLHPLAKPGVFTRAPKSGFKNV